MVAKTFEQVSKQEILRRKRLAEGRTLLTGPYKITVHGHVMWTWQKLDADGHTVSYEVALNTRLTIKAIRDVLLFYKRELERWVKLPEHQLFMDNFILFDETGSRSIEP